MLPPSAMMSDLRPAGIPGLARESNRLARVRVPRAPGISAMAAGPWALMAVASPRAAPEWFVIFFSPIVLTALVLALWAATGLAVTLRRYRAESIPFDGAAQGLSLAATGFFRAGQLGAMALFLGVASVLALALPGLPVLAALLTPVLAIVLAAVPGAVRVPRHADAALCLVVPARSLPRGVDAEARLRIGWRFGARMGAVRAAIADRSAPLPPEARDIAKALDGGGMIRPPIVRLHPDPAGALRLRARGLKAVLAASFPVALAVWVVAALMPAGALAALPRPADLWPFAAPSVPPPSEGTPATNPGTDPQPQGSSADGSTGSNSRASSNDPGQGAGGEGTSDPHGQSSDGQAAAAGGAASDGLAASGSGRDAGEQGDSASGRGSGQSAGAGAGGGAPGAGPGSDPQPGGESGGGSGNGNSAGAGAGGGAPGAGPGSDPQPGGESGGGSGDGRGAGAGGGARATGAGSGAGDGPSDGAGAGAETGPGAPLDPRGAGGGMFGAGFASDGVSVSGRPTGDGSSGNERGPVMVSGTGEGGEDRVTMSPNPASQGGETLAVRPPPSLFAPPGAAPPAILRNLSAEQDTDLPRTPALPPRQRLPAWIADLYP